MNVPLPLEVHNTVLLLVALDPAAILIAPELLQVSNGLVPATAVGAAAIVTDAVVVYAAHPPAATTV